MKKYFWLVGIYILMLLSFIFDWGTHDSEIQKLIYLIAPIITITTGHIALKTFGLKGPRSTSLIMILTGMYLWFIAEMFFLYIDVYNLNPSPSWADFFFIIGYPFFLISILIEWRLFGLKLSRLSKKLKTILLLISSVITVIVIYLGYFVAFDPGETFIINLVGISWSLGDLVVGIALICVTAMVWEFRKGLVVYPWIAFALWATFNIIADTIYGIFPDSAFDGSPLAILLDSLWVAGYFFMSYYFLENKNIVTSLKNKYLSNK